MTTAERRSDLRSEIEEIDADVMGWRFEIESLKEQIAAAKAERAAKIAERNSLKTVKV